MITRITMTPANLCLRKSFLHLSLKQLLGATNWRRLNYLWFSSTTPISRFSVLLFHLLYIPSYKIAYMMAIFVWKVSMNHWQITQIWNTSGMWAERFIISSHMIDQARYLVYCNLFFMPSQAKSLHQDSFACTPQASSCKPDKLFPYMHTSEGCGL